MTSWGNFSHYQLWKRWSFKPKFTKERSIFANIMAVRHISSVEYSQLRWFSTSRPNFYETRLVATPKAARRLAVKAEFLWNKTSCPQTARRLAVKAEFLWKRLGVPKPPEDHFWPFCRNQTSTANLRKVWKSNWWHSIEIRLGGN